MGEEATWEDHEVAYPQQERGVSAPEATALSRAARDAIRDQ